MSQTGKLSPEDDSSHLGMLAMCIVSLCVTMSYSQSVALQAGSFQVITLQVASALLPLLSIRRILDVLVGRALLLAVFGVSAGMWHLLRGDVQVVLEMGLLLLVLAWLSIDNARLNVDTLVKVYLLVLAIGVTVNLTSDFSPYGLIPGYTQKYVSWIVSFFPNVAYSAFLSLAMIFVLTKDKPFFRAYPLVQVVALYFVLLSNVRTALIGLLLYGFMRWLLNKRLFAGSAGWSFSLSLFVAIAMNVLVVMSPVLIQQFQSLPLVSDLFLKGKGDLSADEILKQLYRPWLWLQQLNLFVTSPFLMGQGTFQFEDVDFVGSDDHITSSGSEALPTRLLAIYGIPGLMFTIYCVLSLWRAAKNHDKWACSVFPVVVLMLMQWGSAFHPSDAMCIIFMLMVFGGSRAFPWTEPEVALEPNDIPAVTQLA